MKRPLFRPRLPAWMAAAALLLVPFGLLVASTSGAQPRRTPAKRVSDAGADTGGAMVPDVSPTPNGAGARDGGAGDGSDTSGSAGAGNLSPLTPEPREFAGAHATSADYDRLLSEVAALRARIAVAGDTLFRSKIGLQVKLEGRHAKLLRFTVALDEGAVYTAPQGFRPEDFTTVYEHALAPGKHMVTIDLERGDDRDDSFRTSQRTRFTVEVPKEKKLDVQVRLEDDSTMGGDFPSDLSGHYDLRIRVKAAAAR